MLIKAVPTGRQFGDKRERETSVVTIDGVKLTVYKSDCWEGGDGTPNVQQQYWRMSWIEQPKVNWP